MKEMFKTILLTAIGMFIVGIVLTYAFLASLKSDPFERDMVVWDRGTVKLVDYSNGPLGGYDFQLEHHRDGAPKKVLLVIGDNPTEVSVDEHGLLNVQIRLAPGATECPQKQ